MSSPGNQRPAGPHYRAYDRPSWGSVQGGSMQNPASSPAAHGGEPSLAAADIWAEYTPVPLRASGTARWALALGVAGLGTWLIFGLGIVPAVYSLVLARSAQKEIDDSGGWRRGRGMVNAGRTMSWITVALVCTHLLAGALLYLLFVAALWAETRLRGA